MNTSDEKRDEIKALCDEQWERYQSIKAGPGTPAEKDRKIMKMNAEFAKRRAKAANR